MVSIISADSPVKSQDSKQNMKNDEKITKYSLNIKSDEKKSLFEDMSNLITPK